MSVMCIRMGCNANPDPGPHGLHTDPDVVPDPGGKNYFKNFRLKQGCRSRSEPGFLAGAGAEIFTRLRLRLLLLLLLYST